MQLEVVHCWLQFEEVFLLKRKGHFLLYVSTFNAIPADPKEYEHISKKIQNPVYMKYLAN
jgi:hypothetical protein